MLDKLKLVFSWVKEHLTLTLSILAGIVVVTFIIWISVKLNKIESLETEVFNLKNQIALTELKIQEVNKEKEIAALQSKDKELEKKIKDIKKSLETEIIPPNITTDEIVKKFKEIFP